MHTKWKMSRSCFVYSMTLAVLLALLPTFSAGQAAPTTDFNSGFTPYQQYHGGDIDSVNVATGSVNLHIPLVSFPQRGSALRLTFAINYNSSVVKRPRVGFGAQAYYQWSEVDTNPVSVSVFDDQAYGIYENANCQPNPPCGKSGQVTYHFYSVVTPDGAQHLMGYTSGTPGQTGGAQVLRSLDMTGLYLTIPDAKLGESGAYVVYDKSGIQYNGWATELGILPNGRREDTNGNLITLASGTYTDTMGRSIPAPPTPASASNTDTSGCTGPLPITKAVLWQVPGYNGVLYPIKFCYASVLVNILDDGMGGPNGGPDGFANQETVLQSIALPDAQTLSFATGTAWEFEYNDQGSGGQYRTLTKVTLPTGGSISYVYQLLGDSSDLQRSVTQRTVSDGVTSKTWTYSYTLPTASPWIGTTIVTAPEQVPSDTVYSITEASAANFDSGVETQAAHYQGSHSSGTLLRTDAKAMTFYSNPYYAGAPTVAGFGPKRAGQLLNQETTTLPNGQVSQTKYAYDNGGGFTVYGTSGSPCCTFNYGLLTQSQFLDYGSGAPGPILKQVSTTYNWQVNSNYLNSNLLTLPSQIVTSDVSGNKCAETDYAYDDSNRLVASGISTQHGSPPAAVRGNPSSIAHQLSSAPCATNATWTATTSYTNSYDTGETYQSINPLGNATTYSYSASFAGAYVTQTQFPTTNSVTHIISGNYDFNTGLLTSFTDQNSQPSSYSYDYSRRVISATFPPGGGQKTFTYTDAPGSLQVLMQQQQTSTPTWVQRTAKFDGLGRTVQTQLGSDPDGADSTDTTYDALGRVYTVSNPHRSSPSPTDGTTTYTYDALGRATQVTQPDGNTVLTNYAGRATQVQDEGNGTRRVSRVSQRDGLGRLRSICEVSSTTLPVGSSATPSACGQDIAATGFLTTYGYDPLGNLTSVTQAGLNSRAFAYDSFSRLTSASNPESGSAQYKYDSDTNCASPSSFSTLLISKLDARNIRTCMQYDNLNRLTQKNYSDGTQTANFIYDQTSAYGATLTNTIGRLSSETTASPNPTAKIFSYDQLGRVNNNSQCTPQNCANNTAFPINYSYDLLGDTLSSSNGEGVTISYAYNAAPLLITVTSSLVDSNHPATLLSALHYNPAGALLTGTLGNNLSETRTYDQRLRLASVTNGSIYSLTIPATGGYAPDSNILAANNNVNGNWTYGYDDFNRLLTANATGQAYTYDYDRYGNRWHQNGPHSSQLGFDANNRITGVTGVAFDSAGNTTGDGTTTYTFDAEGRISSSTNTANGLWCDTYNAEGQRVRKTNITQGTCPAPTQSTSYDFLYDLSGHEIAMVSGTGVWDRGEVYAGGRHLATYNNATTYFIHTDWLGTDRVRTTVSGTVYQACTSLPFGDNFYCPNSDATPTHFTGKQHLYESGLDNFDARYYTSPMGRFMSPDWSDSPVPVPFANLTNPQSLNLYSYVKNNPLNFTDPDGHCCDTDDILNAVDFVSGFINAAASNNGVAPRKDAAGDSTFASGQIAGDVATTIQGGVEVVLGVTGEVGGVALDSTGLGAVAGIPANVASAGVIAHGGAVAADSAGNLIKDAINTPIEKRQGDFKPSERERYIRDNASANGGTNTCENCNQEVVRTQNREGQTPPKNQLHVHHDPPIHKGGGRHSKKKVLCRECHTKEHQK